jgi:hypothetical protein
MKRRVRESIKYKSDRQKKIESITTRKYIQIPNCLRVMYTYK